MIWLIYFNSILQNYLISKRLYLVRDLFEFNQRSWIWFQSYTTMLIYLEGEFCHSLWSYLAMGIHILRQGVAKATPIFFIFLYIYKILNQLFFFLSLFSLTVLRFFLSRWNLTTSHVSLSISYLLIFNFFSNFITWFDCVYLQVIENQR